MFRGTLIAGGVVTHMGLFAAERADAVYPVLVKAGIIAPCKTARAECPLCRYTDTWGPPYHLGEGFTYQDFREAARRLFETMKRQEADESDARVTAALANVHLDAMGELFSQK